PSAAWQLAHAPTKPGRRVRHQGWRARLPSARRVRVRAVGSRSLACEWWRQWSPPARQAPAGSDRAAYDAASATVRRSYLSLPLLVALFVPHIRAYTEAPLTRYNVLQSGRSCAHDGCTCTATVNIIRLF